MKKGQFATAIALTAALLSANALPASAVTAFTDIDGSFAKEAIIKLAQAGIVDGVDNDKFNPTGQMTREDFIIVLVKALNLDVSTAPPMPTFSDVLPSDYAYKYIEAATAAGLIQGVEAGVFGKGETLSREQMTVFFVRAITQATGESIDGKAANLTFADKDAISDYAKDAVAAAMEWGLIAGYPDGSFNPLTQASRQDVASVAVNFLKTANKHEEEHASPKNNDSGGSKETPAASPAPSSTPVPAPASSPVSGSTSNRDDDDHNHAPYVVNAIQDQTVTVGKPALRLPLSDVFKDADNDALTITSETSDSQIATAVIDGELIVTGYAAGETTVVLKAVDRRGAQATSSFKVTVLVQEPAVARSLPLGTFDYTSKPAKPATATSLPVPDLDFSVNAASPAQAVSAPIHSLNFTLEPATASKITSNVLSTYNFTPTPATTASLTNNVSDMYIMYDFTKKHSFTELVSIDITDFDFSANPKDITIGDDFGGTVGFKLSQNYTNMDGLITALQSFLQEPMVHVNIVKIDEHHFKITPYDPATVLRIEGKDCLDVFTTTSLINFTVSDGTNSAIVFLNGDAGSMDAVITQINDRLTAAQVKVKAEKIDGVGDAGPNLKLVSTIEGSQGKVIVGGEDAALLFTADHITSQGTDAGPTKVFTVGDGIQTATMTLDTNYTDLSGLINFINTELSNNGVQAAATPVSDGSSFTITSTAVGTSSALTIGGPDKNELFSSNVVQGKDAVDHRKSFTVSDATYTAEVNLDQVYADIDALADDLQSTLTDAQVDATVLAGLDTLTITSTDRGYSALLAFDGTNDDEFFADSEYHGIDMSDRSVTFTVNDGTNTATVLLNSRYDAFGDIIDVINTQLAAGNVQAVASAGANNTVVITTAATGADTELNFGGMSASMFTSSIYQGSNAVNGSKVFTVSDGTNTATVTLTASLSGIQDVVNAVNAALAEATVAAAAEAVDAATFRIISTAKGTDATLTIGGTNGSEFFAEGAYHGTN